MQIRHAVSASAVGLLLTPIGLLGMVLLIPVALLLLAALPIVGVVALLALVRLAPDTNPPADHPHAPAPVSHWGAYSS